MPLITTYAPHNVFYSAVYEWGAFRADMQRFGRMVRGELVAGPTRLETHPTVQDVLDVTAGGVVAVDIETDGIDPTACKLRTVGLGNTEWGLSHEWGANAEVEEAIFTLLAEGRVVKIFHNGPWFDIRVLERYGAVINNWVDTRDERRAVSSTSRLSLAYVTSLYDDAPPWKEGDDENEKLALTTDYEALKKYNAEDCVRTARIHKAMSSELDARTRRLYDLHAELSVVCADMHTTGIPVDFEQRARLDAQLLQLHEERKAKFLALCGVEGMRCNPNDLRALLFARHENERIKRFSIQDPTDKNQWIDKEVGGTISADQNALLLLLIQPDCPPEAKPIIEAYWQAEGARKARSTYVASEKVSSAIGKDGRIRPGWNSCGTDTGRFSCNSPNLLNLAKKKDEEGGALVGTLPDMRSMYRAPEGHVLIEADYSQQELRVMWAVSGDEVLGAALQSGDVYTQDAIEIFRLPPTTTKKTCKPEARQTAKVGHLGFQYGAGTDTLYKQFLEANRSMQYSACKAVHMALRKLYWRTVEYWQEEHTRVLECGYSESRLLHRRRVYPKEPQITDTANYPIQATASDITNLATIDVWHTLRRTLPSAKIVIQQYDAIYVMVPERHSGEAQRILVDCMTKPHTICGRQMTFPVDVSVKDRWGKL